MGYGYGGNFGGGNNMQALMRQAQKMQEDMKKAKEEIEATEFRATVGGGMVEVVMMGDRTVKAVNIKPEVVDPDDVEMLEDLVASAVNECLSKIAAEEKARLPIGM